MCQIPIRSLPNRSCYTWLRLQWPQTPTFLWESQVNGWSLVTVTKVLWKDSLRGLPQTPHYTTRLQQLWHQGLQPTLDFSTHSKFQHMALEGQLCPRFSVAHRSSHIHQATSLLVFLDLRLFWSHRNWVSRPLLSSKVWSAMAAGTQL